MIRNLKSICNFNSPLPCDVMYPQIPRIQKWTSFGVRGLFLLAVGLTGKYSKHLITTFYKPQNIIWAICCPSIFSYAISTFYFITKCFVITSTIPYFPLKIIHLYLKKKLRIERAKVVGLFFPHRVKDLLSHIKPSI